MIPVGKAIVCLIWLFWIIVIDNTVVGQDNKSMSIMDHSKMTLAEIEKVKNNTITKMFKNPTHTDKTVSFFFQNQIGRLYTPIGLYVCFF